MVSVIANPGRKKAAALVIALCIALSGLLLLFGSLTGAAHAVSSGSVTVAANVQQDIELGLNTNAVGFGSVTPSGSPYTVNNAVYATVRSNVPWNLQHAAVVLSHADGTNTHTMPMLEYRKNGAGGFTAHPSTATTVNSGNATAGTLTSFDYKQVVPWENTPPGAYSGSVSYTAVAQ